MRRSLTLCWLATVGATIAPAYNVTIEGVKLQNQLMPSVEWSGGSMQLTARVRVLNDDGTPINGVHVGLSARSGAGLARLREIGVTSAGEAIVVSAFDVPVLSLAKVELTACVEPEGDCSVTKTYDIRKRFDLEIDNGYSEDVGLPNFSTSTNGKTQSEQILSNSYQYQATGRLVMNLFANGSVEHASTFSLYAEGGAFFLHQATYRPGVAYFGNGFGAYVLKTITSAGLHPSAGAGMQGEAFGRLYLQGSFSPPLSGNPADLRARVAYAQPVGRRLQLVGGYAIDLPEFAGSQNHYGSTRGPLFGIALSRARAASWSATLIGSWQSTGLDQFKSTNAGTTTTWSLPATASPSVQFSIDYHRGGPAFLSLYVSAQQIGTSQKAYSVGTNVTLRNFLRKTAR